MDGPLAHSRSPLNGKQQCYIVSFSQNKRGKEHLGVFGALGLPYQPAPTSLKFELCRSTDRWGFFPVKMYIPGIFLITFSFL